MNKRFKSLLQALAVIVGFELVNVFIFGGEAVGAEGVFLLAFIAAWASESQPAPAEAKQ